MLALAGGKRHEFRSLVRAEEPLGNVLDVRHRADPFHVDTDLAIRRECEQSQIARMRGVELKSIACGKRRFSLRTITELDAARRGIQVSSQKNPQRSPREDERSPQMIEPEPAGAIRFVGREKKLELFDHRIRCVSQDRPNVHSTTGEFMLHVSR